MFILCVIVSVFLAVIAIGSGLANVNRVPQMMQVLRHVRADGIAQFLGLALLAGGIGLIVGLFVAPIGVAAALGLVLYFLGAMIAHVRVGDPLVQVLNPLVPMILAAVALALRLATA